MEAKFTPGPWIKRYSDRVTPPDDVDGSKSIAHCYSTNGYDCEANARLIAAAPDLLASCKLAIETINGLADQQAMPDDWYESKLASIDAAIAKATTNNPTR